MNWNQLQYILTIAEEKSITKAAQKLYISQPSLSLSIQSLEKEIGVTLFDRRHNEIKLTYAGTLFHDWAQSTLRSHAQLEWKLSDIADNSKHLIRLGISPHRSTIILPPVLKRFFSVYPNCDMQLVEKPTFVLKDMLKDNELDLLIDVPHPDTINYHSEFLAEEEIVLALPASFSSRLLHSKRGEICSNTKHLSLSVLTDQPFIMLSAGHVIGEMSRKMCEGASFYPNTRLVCSNIESALSLVDAQLGAAFVPSIFAKQDRYSPNVQYWHIEEFLDSRKLCAIYRKNMYQPLQFQALLSLLKEEVKHLYEPEFHPEYQA